MNDERKQALADVERTAHELARSLGLEIVELVFRGQGRHSLLRIDVDRAGVPGIGLADCERFSRELGEKIEDLAFSSSPYELQVSSPGIDRPIRSDDDLRRNSGRPVWLEFRDEAERIRELRGTLVAGSGPEAVAITTEQGEVLIARDRIVFIKQDVTVGKRRRSEP